jgi:hypothetical protein
MTVSGINAVGGGLGSIGSQLASMPDLFYGGEEEDDWASTEAAQTLDVGLGSGLG